MSGTEEIEFGKTNIKYRVDQDATKMIGQNIVNHEGDELGTIGNFLITDTNNVEYAIISIGDFLSIGEKLVAVPKINLQLNNN